MTAQIRDVPGGARFYFFAFPAGSVARTGDITFLDVRGTPVTTLSDVALGTSK